ncbi:hypothetical protein, partial [Tenacibaculum discolor]|uniref:hypothetical protein n=1 Tax=Tenacibaculum discolor TaxID=361581 RepID=UPI00191C835D
VRNPVVIEIGAGTAVPSVRNFSHQMLIYAGARLVRINVDEAQVPSGDDVGLALGGLSALQLIDAVLQTLS